jgi:hypothetical protein
VGTTLEKIIAAIDDPAVIDKILTHLIEVEFALKSKSNPIGVAEYRLRPRLPAEFKGKLPTAKQLTDTTRALLPARK